MDGRNFPVSSRASVRGKVVIPAEVEQVRTVPTEVGPEAIVVVGARQGAGGSSLLGSNGRWGCRERVARRSAPYAGAHRRTPYTEVRAANEQASGKRQHEKDRAKPKKPNENNRSTRGSTQLRGSRDSDNTPTAAFVVDI